METFRDRDAQADAVADALAGALAGTGARTLVVTGGGTPGPVYDRIARRDLAWKSVAVTPSDERFVDGESDQSNARLIRQRLLVGQAAAARFVPLKDGGATPDADADGAEPVLRLLLPWSAVLLGVGEDGHIASLFPDDPDLAARLDPDGERLCVGVAKAGLEPFVSRISLTLGALVRSALVVLMITGEAKRALVERTLADPDSALPLAAILRQRRAPVRVLWAP